MQNLLCNVYIVKSGIFDQPELFDPKLTRHFLQYARRAHARIIQQQLA
jgi:hypothetical protein